ncbi:hypothetical protein PybrP1_011120 [[Pythium] brassicae (nom. inval.)]|nr:hypothetical protein PybrP1_011120 [[Pythium] brassicae (nom. inval.)]
MSPSLPSESPASYTAYPAAPSLESQPMSTHSSAPSTAALATIYASYVVRVHTRHGIKTLSFDTLAAYFTFTAKKAAEDLGISSRTLIRVCRSLGIRRWPYLGFRSEKNVDRIRHEAIESLRRKLEKEGAASPAAVHYPSASSLRGASAKRLLQVKLPQGGHMSPMSSTGYYQQQKQYTLSADNQSWSVQSIDDTESEDDTDVEMMDARPSFSDTNPSLMPLLTPQSASSGFKLKPAPSRPVHPFHPSASTTFGMPSLNLLVDASLLTAFKHDTPHELAAASPPQPLPSPRIAAVPVP